MGIKCSKVEGSFIVLLGEDSGSDKVIGIRFQYSRLAGAEVCDDGGGCECIFQC